MAKLKKLQTYDFKVELSPKNTDNLSRPIKEFLDVANKIVSIQQLLDLEQDEIEGATEEVRKMADRLSTVIRKFQRASIEANFDTAMSKTTTDLLEKLDKMRQAEGPVSTELWGDFLTSATDFDTSMTKALDSPKKVEESTVRGAVSNVIDELKVSIFDKGPKVMDFNYSCEKGRSVITSKLNSTADSYTKGPVDKVARRPLSGSQMGPMAILAKQMAENLLCLSTS